MGIKTGYFLKFTRLSMQKVSHITTNHYNILFCYMMNFHQFTVSVHTYISHSKGFQPTVS